MDKRGPLSKMVDPNGDRPDIAAELAKLDRNWEESEVEELDMVLEAGADPNIYTFTPALSLAAKHDTDSIHMVKQLLARGANVNAVDHAGMTALHEACDTDNLELVKCLVEAGADVNADCFFNILPLDNAAVVGNVEIVKFLVESGADPEEPMDEMLHDNMDRGRIPLVNYLLTVGGKVCADDLVHLVSEKDSKSMIKNLLSQGVDINERGGDGETAIDAACTSMDAKCDMLEFLVDNGADLSLKSDFSGNTVLHVAAKSLDRDKLQYLHHRKVDLNARNKENRTAIDVALLEILRVVKMEKDRRWRNEKEKYKKGLRGVRLLAFAGASAAEEVLVQVREAFVNKDIKFNGVQRRELTRILELLQQPRKLTQLGCIAVRASLPTPINESASVLVDMLPEPVYKGIIDYTM